MKVDHLCEGGQSAVNNAPSGYLSGRRVSDAR